MTIASYNIGIKRLFFAKIMSSLQTLAVFAKSSILDVCLGSEYSSELQFLTKYFSQISGEKPDARRWKSNFRCALHQSQDIYRCKEKEEPKRDSKFSRVYRFRRLSEGETGKTLTLPNFSIIAYLITVDAKCLQMFWSFGSVIFTENIFGRPTS